MQAQNQGGAARRQRDREGRCGVEAEATGGQHHSAAEEVGGTSRWPAWRDDGRGRPPAVEVGVDAWSLDVLPVAAGGGGGMQGERGRVRRQGRRKRGGGGTSGGCGGGRG